MLLGVCASAAKPTLGGCSRKTVYTFLRNALPMTQTCRLTPMIAPTQPGIPWRFSRKSSGDIVHNLPPKLMPISMLDVHGIE